MNIVALCLIIIGGLLFLQNFGFVSGDMWDVFWKLFWPMAIVVVGIKMMYKDEGKKKK